MESIHSDNEEQTGSQGSKHHQDQEQIEDYSSDTESSEKKCNKRKGTGADKKVESSQRSHKPKKLRREKSSSSDDSSDTSGNLSGKKLFEEFLKWHEKKKSKSRSRSESKSRSNKHRKDKKPKAKEVELVEKSGIIVNRFKLDLITESNTKNPREMTRQLFKLIVGTEELAKMTIVKTKGRELMPEKYLEAIFEYVTIHTANGRELNAAEFKKCVGKMLSTIRESLKSNNDNKNDAKHQNEDHANKKNKNDDGSDPENDV
ncbi:MATH and LRR domain-containing protein PFE0570w-like [Cotesia glomerata]|uniref:MATH and LRR domain-containing protein PFE0570w-like n=2 Tax=Cotesia glomerata TaxID=32391 RepID=UPI001D02813A|nr:MATH and LRR domain-containing protein PFE0570w-like [Cotesia glomerata]